MKKLSNADSELKKKHCLLKKGVYIEITVQSQKI